MPITSQEQLDDLRLQVRSAVEKADTDAALALLLASIPNNRPKNSQILLLSGRMRDIYNYEVSNRLPQDQLDILRNELRHDVLLFIDRLTLIDFSESAPPRPELKPGHLLYRVPSTMAIREAHECLVRVAHQLSHVLQGITLDDSTSLEEIPVAEIMEVEIIDPSPADERAFDVLLLSDGEQLVDEYSFTEWVFQVRALREGSFQLFLKISVLLTVNGKERTKNIVLRRPIEVTAQADQATLPASFQRVEPTASQGNTSAPGWGLDEIITEVQDNEYAPDLSDLEQVMKEKGAPSPKSTPARSRPPASQEAGGSAPPLKRPIPSPAPAPKRKRSPARYLSIAASVLLIASFGFYLVNTNDDIPSPDKPMVTAPSPDTGDTGGVDLDFTILHPEYITTKPDLNCCPTFDAAQACCCFNELRLIAQDYQETDDPENHVWQLSPEVISCSETQVGFTGALARLTAYLKR